MRALEKAWVGLERTLNRLLAVSERTRPYNPLYHLGPLCIYLLILLVVTGLYLLLLYRPGTERAYASVEAISASWFGSVVRSVHHYTSDALIVVALLHALKMLLSDRFWGSRWLAWTSGWLLVGFFWLTGTMGYFLVWDEAAQWLTEYAVDLIGGAFGVSFFGPQAAGRTYSFFLIILFLHAFLPMLLALLVALHVMRLQRARYWAPRWLMAGATAVLVLLSLAWPVASGLPADLRRQVLDTSLDWWYMGFLPMISRFGNPLFWMVTLIVSALVLALPWLARGRHAGPAVVNAELCGGCTKCAVQCPFGAIDMVPREGGLPDLAVVKPHLCTGCGVCVAACPPFAIELDAVSLDDLHQQVRTAVTAAVQSGQHPTVVYTCDRHAALGTLPPLSADTIATPVQRVRVGYWPDGGAGARPVVACVLPCMGSLHMKRAEQIVAGGASQAIMVACSGSDCGYREGAYRAKDRLKRRPVLRGENVHWLEAAPGSRAALMSLWASATQRGQVAGAQSGAATGRLHALSASMARALMPALVLLAVLFGTAIAANRPATAGVTQGGQIRLALNHQGQLMASSTNLPPEVAARLPEGVDPAMVLGGERFPVSLRVSVDGEVVFERTYRSGGLRREGSISTLETLRLAPGRHDVQVDLMDDGAAWRTVFDDTLEIMPAETRVLIYNTERNVFVPWE